MPEFDGPGFAAILELTKVLRRHRFTLEEIGFDLEAFAVLGAGVLLLLARTEFGFCRSFGARGTSSRNSQGRPFGGLVFHV